MRKSSLPVAAALAAVVLAGPGAGPASALSLVTYVSGKGANTGACASPANPCRTFQYALSQTLAGGEIKALDASNYSPFVIGKSVSITGVEGASVIRNSAGTAITISAGTNSIVTLSNLAVDGFNRTGSYGILLTSAGSLTIRNCAVRNFANDGINLQPAGAFKFVIAQSAITDNGTSGLYVVTTLSGGAARGVLDHVTVTKNYNGVWLSGLTIPFTEVSVVDSIVSNNANNGITAAGPVLHLTGSAVQLNTYGIKVTNGQAKSAGDNAVSANVVDVDPAGALVNVGTQ